MRKNYMTYGMAAKLSGGITGALFIFAFLTNLYFRGGEQPVPERWFVPMLYGPATQFGLLFALFSVNFRILAREDVRPRCKIAASVAASVLVAVAGSMAVSLLQMRLFPADLPEHMKQTEPGLFILAGIIKDLFLAAFAIFISQIIYLTRQRRQVERRNDQLEAENLRTRYEALKNQVNPHFLFNTLSTLDAMVAVDSVRSREYIQKFSSVFRYTLKNTDTVSLADELAFVRNYAEMMQIRHGESLRVEFAADPRWGECLLVPMAVQGLVENAIKHNSFSDATPLTITIATTGDGFLSVSNPCRPREYPEPGEGMGLANLAERYRLKWRRDIAVTRDDGVFRVSIPLISPQP